MYGTLGFQLQSCLMFSSAGGVNAALINPTKKKMIVNASANANTSTYVLTEETRVSKSTTEVFLI